MATTPKVNMTIQKTKQHPYKVVGPPKYKKLVFANAEAARTNFKDVELQFETMATANGNTLYTLVSKKYPNVKQISVRILNHQLNQPEGEDYLTLVPNNIDHTDWIMSEAEALCDFYNYLTSLLVDHCKTMADYEGVELSPATRTDIDNFKIKIPTLKHASTNAFKEGKVDEFNERSGILVLNFPYGVCLNTSDSETEENWLCSVTVQLNLFKDSVTTDASNNRNKKNLEELQANGNSRFKRKPKQPVAGTQVKRAKVAITDGPRPPYVEACRPDLLPPPYTELSTLTATELQQEVQNQMKQIYESEDLTLSSNV